MCVTEPCYMYTGAASGPPTGRAPPRQGSISGSLTHSLGSTVDSSATGSSRQQERAREVLGQVVASQTKVEQLKEEAPGTIVDIVRLLLSCLHAWNLDEALDTSCEEVLGLVRPCKPVSFGLLSKGGCLSLVLPGWGLRIRTRFDPQNRRDVENMGEADVTQGLSASSGGAGSQETLLSSEGKVPAADSKQIAVPIFDQKYHIRWQLSRSLTTQHLLTMVSITNTLMNQSVGAHALASSSGVWKRQTESLDDLEDSDSDSEEVQTQRDNMIRAVWSQVA